MKLSNAQYNNLLQVAILLVNIDKENKIEIDYDKIDGYVNQAISLTRLECDDEDRQCLFSDIEYKFEIRHTSSEFIFDDYDLTKWYSNENISDAFFWNRYRRYLLEKTSLDPVSINKLDDETLPNIMNCLGNPNEKFEGKRLRRGLIIGDVQSGKTATYSGLICKAADAGYKVVILLAGITETLRQQTQERIDEGIVGYTIRKVGKLDKGGKVGVGLDNKARRATSFTSYVKDFVAGSDKIATTLEEHKSLVIFVVKKNVSVLTKLYDWLESQNLDSTLGYVNQPMILIDDEADNASVNTRIDETDPTETNKIIRRICNLFKNANYVGFTATPFANVFIDPDSVDSMKHADLFPEHFIYVLPTPSSYIGPSRVFYDGEDGTERGDCYDRLRFISDIEEPDYASDEYRKASKCDVETLNNGAFYSRHKKEWNGKLPESLREAVLCFFLANVVRDLRGQQSAPRSMLVNMSRFIRVQNLIKEHIDKIYSDFMRDVRYDFCDDYDGNTHLGLFKELEAIWHKHFTNISGISIERVLDKETLLNAVGKISVVVVNGSKSSGKLDYKSNKSLRVIAVGGLALSRGLPLEALLVTYFYRNTSTFDVLMQMGRWFGYRTGYEDLFQVWTSKISADWYREISIATQELKEDIKRMFDQKLTPKDFGIRVRDYCDELNITSRSKMRSSYELQVMESYYGNICDTPYISANTEQNRKNWECISDLTKTLFDGGYDFGFADIDKHKGEDVNSDSSASRYFANVPKQMVVDLLTKIKCSMVNMRFNLSNLLDFINDPETTGIEKWDIVFEGGDGDTQYDIAGLEKIRCARRNIEEHGNVIQISSRRRILGLREGKFALTKEEIDQAEKACRDAWRLEDEDSADIRTVPLKAYFQYLPNRNPLLIVMLLQPNKPDPKQGEKRRLTKFREELGEDKIVAFAIGFPGVKEGGSIKRYKVNKIYYELNMQDEPEEIEDEE